MQNLYDMIIEAADCGVQLVLKKCGDGYLASIGDDLSELDKTALADYRETLYALAEFLDHREPSEEDEEFENWAEAHEALEDQLDEVSDLLDD